MCYVNHVSGTPINCCGKVGLLFDATLIVRAVFVVAVVLSARHKTSTELSRRVSYIRFGANQVCDLRAELRKPMRRAGKNILIDQPSPEIEMRFTLPYVLDVVDRYSYSLKDSCLWTNHSGLPLECGQISKVKTLR
jgi:hypothetical protein